MQGFREIALAAVTTAVPFRTMEPPAVATLIVPSTVPSTVTLPLAVMAFVVLSALTDTSVT